MRILGNNRLEAAVSLLEAICDLFHTRGWGRGDWMGLVGVVLMHACVFYTHVRHACVALNDYTVHPLLYRTTMFICVT